MLNERLTRLLALEGVAVTREDIEMKATSVLQTLLPEIWRNHKCRYTHTHHRKRVREVSSDELVWRAQSNLILSQCHLHQLLKTLGAVGGENHAPDHTPRSTPGVTITGGIPTYPPVTPGCPRDHSGCGNLGKSQLEEMMRCLQRAVVLAQRGRLWVLLQNTCRCLWNSLHCLLSHLPPHQQTLSDSNRGSVYLLISPSTATIYNL